MTAPLRENDPKNEAFYDALDRLAGLPTEAADDLERLPDDLSGSEYPAEQIQRVVERFCPAGGRAGRIGRLSSVGAHVSMVQREPPVRRRRRGIRNCTPDRPLSP